MSTETPQISLDDLDRLLEAEDPDFARSLESLRSIVPDASITIDSSVAEDPDAEGGPDDPEARSTTKQSWSLPELRPKEIFFFLVAELRRGVEYATYLLGKFSRASRAQKGAVFALVLLSGLALWMLAQNLRGIWLPRLGSSQLTRFEPYADFTGTYSGKDSVQTFSMAFPAERFEFLFDKMKVNLRSTTDHPNPMGAFELVAVVDAKSTAIEIDERSTEFNDLLQRVLEGASFTELEGEAGKLSLKNRLKREVNSRLERGLVRNFDFKTFILKP